MLIVLEIGEAIVYGTAKLIASSSHFLPTLPSTELLEQEVTDDYTIFLRLVKRKNTDFILIYAGKQISVLPILSAITPLMLVILMGYFLAVIATIIWSDNLIVARAFNQDILPVDLAFWRWAIAVVTLTPFSALES